MLLKFVESGLAIPFYYNEQEMLERSAHKPHVGYLFEVNQQEYKQPVRFTQPQSLGPLYGRALESAGLAPESKIKLADTLKRFEACPFLGVREMVVAFASTDMHTPFAYHDWQSNLLLEQYRLQPELETADRNIRRVINLHRQELILVGKLIAVVRRLLQAEENFCSGADAAFAAFATYENMTA